MYLYDLHDLILLELTSTSFAEPKSETRAENYQSLQMSCGNNTSISFSINILMSIKTFYQNIKDVTLNILSVGRK